MFNIITAFTKESKGIGYKNRLPWEFNKEDMAFFKQTTTKTEDPTKRNCVIMGRNTWDSLPVKPLPNRVNIVISGKLSNTIFPVLQDKSHDVFKSLDEALTSCSSNSEIETVYVIGGQQLYEEAIKNEFLNEIHATVIEKEYECDTYFPVIPGYMKVTSSKESITNKEITYKTYKNMIDPHSEEHQYLNCLRKIMEKGEKVDDRTGVGTLSLFDENFNFSIITLNPEEEDQTKLKYIVPALTTKSLYLKGIILELIWFLRGETDATWLSDKGVHIWDGHTSKKHLQNNNLDYEEGQLGPGYGHQWVNWGGEWSSTNKEAQTGINQIQNIIELLSKSPSSRRAVLSAWNVSDLSKMALPPCHVMYLFKVSDHDKPKKTLNCKVILRSNDMFLGSPFNIMSATTLTILLSRILNMLPGKIAVSISDAHIYLNHLDQVKEQLTRPPLKFPVMQLNKSITCYEDTCELTYEDFGLTEYYKWPKISAKMAI
jgi:dihydrofolate reductase/thymidylate synthase